MPSKKPLQAKSEGIVSMPDLATLLDGCFDELSREYEIEKVDYLPVQGEKRKSNVPVWRLIIQATVSKKVEDIEVFIAFPREFPYQMPFVIVPDDRFKYLPHISYKSRKLCLYEDGIVFDADNVCGLIRDNISKTRRWVERYANQDNASEYAQEISSYWIEQYDKEEEPESHCFLFGRMPEETRKLTAYTYQVAYYGTEDKYFDQTIICGDEETEEYIRQNIYIRSKARKETALYIHSLIVPLRPPCSITGKQLSGYITDKADRETFIKYLNTNKKGLFLFSIGLQNKIGGVSIPKLQVNKPGFRSGILKAFDIITKYDYANRNFVRLYASVYDENRIAKRTAGELMEKRNYVIAGLGSVGSNLCYYLNGYNNAQFALIDPENLTIDNLGRHLLGFNYLDQSKALAVAHYLTDYRPDRKVIALRESIEAIPTEELNSATALFVCTGDVMSEKWLLQKMCEVIIQTPAFILWLEPYGASGIMVYVNPSDKEGLNALREQVQDGFMRFNLIDRVEYEEGDKLTKSDVGCHGQYALYSANDVTLYLSAMFPKIDELLTTPAKSKVFQWIGNIEIAAQKGIRLVSEAAGLKKNSLRGLTI